MTTKLWFALSVAVAGLLLPGTASAACTYSLGTAGVAAPHSGGWFSVPVYTQPGCYWVGVPTAGWVTMSTSRGYGSGAIVFYVSPNPYNRPRALNINQPISPGTCGLGTRSCTVSTPVFHLSVYEY